MPTFSGWLDVRFHSWKLLFSHTATVHKPPWRWISEVRSSIFGLKLKLKNRRHFYRNIGIICAQLCERRMKLFCISQKKIFLSELVDCRPRIFFIVPRVCSPVMKLRWQPGTNHQPMAASISCWLTADAGMSSKNKSETDFSALLTLTLTFDFHVRTRPKYYNCGA